MAQDSEVQAVADIMNKYDAKILRAFPNATEDQLTDL